MVRARLGSSCLKFLEVLLTPTFSQVECYFLAELLKGCVTHNHYTLGWKVTK